MMFQTSANGEKHMLRRNLLQFACAIMPVSAW